MKIKINVKIQNGAAIIAVISIMILLVSEYLKNSIFIGNLYFDVVFTIFSTIYLEYSENGALIRISLFIIPLMLLYSSVFNKPSFAFPWLCFKFTTMVIYIWTPLLLFAELYLPNDSQVNNLYKNKFYDKDMITGSICWIISSGSQLYIFIIVHKFYNKSRLCSSNKSEKCLPSTQQNKIIFDNIC